MVQQRHWQPHPRTLAVQRRHYPQPRLAHGHHRPQQHTATGRRRCRSARQDPVLPSGQSTLDRYFDTTAFLPAPTYSLGNDSRTQPKLRIPGLKTFDLNISRSQPVGERMNSQFRAELFNAFNTPQFGAPNGNVTATNFGAITGASNSRVVQMGLRLRF